jgi:hypothetical protein
MGIIFKPEDALKGKKSLMKKALKDLNPGLKESVEKILIDWEGKRSEDRLVKLVGKEKATNILKYLQ